MEQCKNKSLRSSGLRSKNGFSIRNKMKKNESRWMNSLPFTLVAKNKNLSKSLYGLSVPITKVYNDVPFISLKNTAYVSFDYENFCHTDIDISKLIKFKKPSTIPTIYKSQSGNLSEYFVVSFHQYESDTKCRLLIIIHRNFIYFLKNLLTMNSH